MGRINLERKYDMFDITLAEARLLEWLDRHRGEMLTMLEELVNTDSGSLDKAGVDAVGAILIRFFQRQKISTSVLRDQTHGDAIMAAVQKQSSADSRPILLLGHRDTVFAKGEAGRRPFHIKDGRAYGPGVGDMKAGIVMNAFVLAAFQEMGGQPAPLAALFTGDEEIASPFSRSTIEQNARRALAVFNSEPARANGNVVTGRKGGVFILLEVFGKSAHSGVNFFDGVSAINELADKIVRLKAVTNQAKGVTLNVGLVRGGETVNTVAPYAAAEIDLRFVQQCDREASLSEIRKVAEDCRIAGTSAKVIIKGEFLPLVETQHSPRLFEIYRSAANELGIKLQGEFTGGCADSGFASAQGVPTLCGVGAVGGKAHTRDEYIEVDTLTDRAKVLALAICRLNADQLYN
jgi:glutamate carboxypeptidase